MKRLAIGTLRCIHKQTHQRCCRYFQRLRQTLQSQHTRIGYPTLQQTVQVSTCNARTLRQLSLVDAQQATTPDHKIAQQIELDSSRGNGFKHFNSSMALVTKRPKWVFEIAILLQKVCWMITKRYRLMGSVRATP